MNAAPSKPPLVEKEQIALFLSGIALFFVIFGALCAVMWAAGLRSGWYLWPFA